ADVEPGQLRRDAFEELVVDGGGGLVEMALVVPEERVDDLETRRARVGDQRVHAVGVEVRSVGAQIDAERQRGADQRARQPLLRGELGAPGKDDGEERDETRRDHDQHAGESGDFQAERKTAHCERQASALGRPLRKYSTLTCQVDFSKVRSLVATRDPAKVDAELVALVKRRSRPSEEAEIRAALAPLAPGEERVLRKALESDISAHPLGPAGWADIARGLDPKLAAAREM